MGSRPPCRASRYSFQQEASNELMSPYSLLLVVVLSAANVEGESSRFLPLREASILHSAANSTCEGKCSGSLYPAPILLGEDSKLYSRRPCLLYKELIASDKYFGLRGHVILLVYRMAEYMH